MPEEKEQSATPTQPKRKLSPNAVRLYVNQTEFALTPWDIQIQLGNIHSEDSGLIIEELATLFMSPQHAKAFAMALLTNVASWETAYGQIQLPASIVARATGKLDADGKPILDE